MTVIGVVVSTQSVTDPQLELRVRLVVVPAISEHLLS